MSDKEVAPTRLSKEDSKKVSGWFNKNASPEIKCAVCGNRNWFSHSRLYQLPTTRFDRQPRPKQTRTVLPVVVVECGTCSNLLYFNASKTGINALDGYEAVDEKIDE